MSEADLVPSSFQPRTALVLRTSVCRQRSVCVGDLAQPGLSPTRKQRSTSFARSDKRRAGKNLVPTSYRPRTADLCVPSTQRLCRRSRPTRALSNQEAALHIIRKGCQKLTSFHPRSNLVPPSYCGPLCAVNAASVSAISPNQGSLQPGSSAPHHS